MTIVVLAEHSLGALHGRSCQLTISESQSTDITLQTLHENSSELLELSSADRQQFNLVSSLWWQQKQDHSSVITHHLLQSELHK
jgi:hypothetical protein